MILLTRVERTLEDHGDLIPTEAFIALMKILAEQMRRRGLVDSANYMERAASAAGE